VRVSINIYIESTLNDVSIATDSDSLRQFPVPAAAATACSRQSERQVAAITFLMKMKNVFLPRSFPLSLKESKQSSNAVVARELSELT